MGGTGGHVFFFVVNAGRMNT